MGSVYFYESKGVWIAHHAGIRISYSESRFGNRARDLAQRALAKMQAGQSISKLEHETLRKTWLLNDAAKMLGMSTGQLTNWMLTGVCEGLEIRPPMRALEGGDKIRGYELLLASERLAEHRIKGSLYMNNGSIA